MIPVVPNGVTNAYKQQSLELLERTFLRISVYPIRRVFRQSHHSFTAAYQLLSSINDCINMNNIEQQNEAILALAPFLRDYTRIVLIADRRPQNRRAPNEPNLLDELDAIPEMNTKANRPIQSIVDCTKKEDTKKDSEPLFLCACCFSDDVPFEEMCQCDEGHLVCTDCLRHYVDEQLDGKGVADFQCMHMEAVPKCIAKYSITQLRRAFPPDRFAQIEEKIFRLNFDRAGMEDGCQCSKCNDLFFVDAKTDNVSCPKCNHRFCRLCNEAPHKLQTCDEAKADKENLDAHAATAEAMTSAVVRKCPRCKRPFLKEGNKQCNKIKCPCGALSCYLCQQEIQGYQHFCQTALCKHETCGKCVLFTNAEEDDRQARRQVVQTALRSNTRKDGDLVAGLLSPPQKDPPSQKQGRRQPLAARFPHDNRVFEPAVQRANAREVGANHQSPGRSPNRTPEPRRRNVDIEVRRANARQIPELVRPPTPPPHPVVPAIGEHEEPDRVQEPNRELDEDEHFCVLM